MTHPDELYDLAADYQMLKAENTRRKKLLKRVEWVKYGLDENDEWILYCPVCNQRPIEGHADDCELKKELADE